MKKIAYIISFGVVFYLPFVGNMFLNFFSNASARDAKFNSKEVVGCFSEVNFKLVYKYLIF